MMELALVENIQREDLDAIEVAISFQRLIEEFSLTQEGLGDRVGKKRATIANYLRLLNLPVEIQSAIREKRITMGHARALLAIEDKQLQLDVFGKILAQDLSVRKVESLAQRAKMKDADATNDTHEVEEPWLPIETKLVVSSVVGGVAILIVLAIFVHMFILR